MSSFEVCEIKKRFGSVEVLNGISLCFEPGTVTSIVGDNGAGKSTLLKILAGVFRANEGTLRLNGETLDRGSPASHRRAGIEMVYQDLALAKNHDVITNLFLGRELISCGVLDRCTMEQEGRSILGQLEINLPRMEQRVGELSGGQQQAVAIARAVLFNPRVLLLDEPTAALAAREVDRVIELVKRQKELGRIIILVSHRLNDVFAVSDRIVVLKRGCVYSDDPKNNLTLTEVVQRIVS
jgi:ABC-type sugar transport system ATPase subunit